MNAPLPLNWLGVYPEIILLVMICVILLNDLFLPQGKRHYTYWLSQATVVVVGLMHLSMLGKDAYPAMQGLVQSDTLGHFMAFAGSAATFVTLAYSRRYIATREMYTGEFYTLSLLSLLGVSVMVQASHFLTIYVGLELMSLSLYAMTALRRDHARSIEAAMKYFVLGAMASGFLLYGMSMIYGATGTLSIEQVFQTLQGGAVQHPGVMTLGLVFIVAGLAFKLGAAPFHMWVPDVYHGAPTSITLMIAAAPKLAAFAVTVRLLLGGLMAYAEHWQQMMMVLAVLSMIIGNVAAIAQSNLKRMLAYSTIGQMGFMLLGLTPMVVGGGTQFAAAGASSALFYLVAYVMTTLGTFGLILWLSGESFESEEIADLSGLFKRSPALGAVMILFLLSLAGIPPTVGFYAKMSVLQVLVSTGNPLYVTLAVVGVLLSLVAAFYYLRVIKVMYFDAPPEGAATVCPSGTLGLPGALLAINGVLVIAMGIFPGWLIGMSRSAIAALGLAG
ncbi:NADH-quinone oxidoreductase subunit NuoN [Amphibiibacter pelophylacis]|uniref:NADH-quinone oxidoreductase subunit NuoN n=1 Tax=Amphibiibacter pelophylacis TaxID=1799477 RepID=A0ACC6P0P8_9BURK